MVMTCRYNVTYSSTVKYSILTNSWLFQREETAPLLAGVSVPYRNGSHSWRGKSPLTGGEIAPLRERRLSFSGTGKCSSQEWFTLIKGKFPSHRRGKCLLSRRGNCPLLFILAGAHARHAKSNSKSTTFFKLTNVHIKLSSTYYRPADTQSIWLDKGWLNQPRLLQVTHTDNWQERTIVLETS